MLGLVLTLTLAAPLDAPLQLSLNDVDRRMMDVEVGASNARVARGLGITAVVLGTMSGVAYIGGTVSNGVASIGNSLAQSLGGGRPGLLPNYTPLLVGSLIGLSVGLAATFFGIHLGHTADADRAELSRARLAALTELEDVSKSRWAHLDEAPVAPAPVAAAGALTAPPLPLPEPGPRKPLVPR